MDLIEEVFVSSSNSRRVPEQVLAHPAVVAMVEQGRQGPLSPEDVRQASEAAAVEPKHLKGLLEHLSTLGVSVEIPIGPLRNHAPNVLGLDPLGPMRD